MTESFWNEKYQSGDTGWDLQQISPPIKIYIDSLTDKNLKILIPGCGNAYEAEYLLEKNFEQVTVLDISKVLTDQLKLKFEGKPIRILNEDFFSHTQTYDLILEQTFFCAIHPDLRSSYVKHAHKLLNHNGLIAGLFFDTDFSRPGPPFGGNQLEYEKLFKPYFSFLSIHRSENSIKPRSGRELFFEFLKSDTNTGSD
ncbi:methyltransferase domain-containing protein [Daejeonella oryzae]|uniref:methyltransferase domain-containing protein n=1 Tax=Daejeonella oryzae TaxID=1122943 RepID=UPI0003FDCE3A|nr:methyltransferase domain-containing protein [Daejeonella oryzae]